MDKRYNICELAAVIRAAMSDWVKNHPQDKGGFANTQKAGMDAAMRFGKGMYNPTSIRTLVDLERSVFYEIENEYSIPC